jgi:hypothetical protein
MSSAIGRGKRSRVLIIGGVLLLLVIAVAGAAKAGSISAPVGKSVRSCYSGAYETVHMPAHTYYNIYNSGTPGSGTCMTFTHGLTMGDIVVKTGTPQGWQYPNISSGWEWGRNPCTGRSGACFSYPVQLSTILAHYAPRSGMRATKGAGAYNLSWDIWFNKTDAHPNQDNATEVMVWLAHDHRRPAVRG